MRNNAMARLAVRVAVSALVCLVASGPALGQTCGPLRVLVQEPGGKPVFGVEVTVAAESHATRARTTGPEGIAGFENITCGAWVVHAAKTGFHESNNSIQVAEGSGFEVDLILTPLVQHDSVDVRDKATTLEQSASETNELHPNEDVKNLPSRPVTVTDTLPLVPGVVRTTGGEINIGGAGEHRGAFVVNWTDVTDPATGKFGQTIPVDSVETVDVLTTPFLAQYGRFTSGVIAVETRRGGENWHAELNDPFPDFRFRSWHMRGIRDSTPRGLLGGPLIAHRLYVMSTLLYSLAKKPERTLPFPFNESKQESINSFNQLDYIWSPRQLLTGTFHWSPQHINFVNPNYFNPQPVTPDYAQHNYVATFGDHLGVRGGTRTALCPSSALTRWSRRRAPPIWY
jgi:hypothetical protein